MMRALYLGLEEATVCLRRKSQRHGSARRFFGSLTKFQVSFSRMERISNSIASCYSTTSVALITSLYVIGSPPFVKKRSGDYLSGGCDSLSNRCGKTVLVGSSAGILCAATLSSAVLARLVVAELPRGFHVRSPPSIVAATPVLRS